MLEEKASFNMRKLHIERSRVSVEDDGAAISRNVVSLILPICSKGDCAL